MYIGEITAFLDYTNGKFKIYYIEYECTFSYNNISNLAEMVLAQLILLKP